MLYIHCNLICTNSTNTEWKVQCPRQTLNLSVCYHLVIPYSPTSKGDSGMNTGQTQVIVRWKHTLLFPLELFLLITQGKYELSSTHLFILPILKTNSKICIPNTYWTHPTVYFLNHLLLPTLAFCSISSTVYIIIDPTLI